MLRTYKMVTPRSIAISVIFCVCISMAKTMDPCTNFTPLPRAAYRGGKCDFERTKPVCDMYLSDNVWYQARSPAGYLTIQTAPAIMATCGTLFPIWMNGSHPTVEDGEVQRTACQTSASGPCVRSSTMTVKNCGDFYVYRLPMPASCPTAYCFGTNDACPGFDPCDMYDHSSIAYDAERSSSCLSGTRTGCDSFRDGSWFQLDNYHHEVGKLEVATSCPASSTACGTHSQMWISGVIAEYSNGTRLNRVCVRRRENCCAYSYTAESKQCDGFTVYHFSQNLRMPGQCQRFCTDDPKTSCNPTTTTSQKTTTSKASNAPARTKNADTEVDLEVVRADDAVDKPGAAASNAAEACNNDELNQKIVQVVVLLLGSLILGALIGTGVTYCIVRRRRNYNDNLHYTTCPDSSLVGSKCGNSPPKHSSMHGRDSGPWMISVPADDRLSFQL